MRKISEWPAVLFRKWLLLTVLAAAFPVVGVIAVLINGDWVLLYLSAALTLFTAGRSWWLYRGFAHQKYETVEGVCVQIKQVPLLRQRNLVLLSDDGTEHTVTIQSKTSLNIGKRYRAYLMGKTPRREEKAEWIFEGFPAAFAVEKVP